MSFPVYDGSDDKAHTPAGTAARPANVSFPVYDGSDDATQTSAPTIVWTGRGGAFPSSAAVQAAVKSLQGAAEPQRVAHQLVPLGFSRLLKCSPVAKTAYYYWWRAQAVTFLVRPNRRTLSALAAMRAQHLRVPGGDGGGGVNGDGDGDGAAGGVGGVVAGAVLPRGTINLHIRRGDKSDEATPTGVGVYTRAARRLLHAHSKLHNNTSEQCGDGGSGTAAGSGADSGATCGGGAADRAGHVFVSTEDPAVLALVVSSNHGDALAFGGAGAGGARGGHAGAGIKLRVVHTDQSRVNLGNADMVQHMGGTRIMLDSLLGLSLALQCDAWVVTMSSNWCRLIDELRATVARKAHGTMVDVGPKSFGQKAQSNNLDW